jgi:hypothetical protein
LGSAYLFDFPNGIFSTASHLIAEVLNNLSIQGHSQLILLALGFLSGN